MSAVVISLLNSVLSGVVKRLTLQSLPRYMVRFDV
jgi:hypothetical protein